jgi:transmembrane sensor
MMTTTPSSDETARREFEAYLRAQDPIDVAATLWHTRREQGLDDAEEAEFQQWLAADPAHESAFARIDESIGLLRNLPPARVAHLRRAAQVDPPHPAAPGRRGRRSWMPGWFSDAPNVRAAALVLCCVVVLAIGVGWSQKQPTFTQAYTAERGHRLEVPLPDGSELSLDSATQVRVALYRDRREVRLEEGQAMFRVAGDAARPFAVQAGSARVTVVGTRFSVRYLTQGASAGEVDVEVEAGHVQVVHAAPETDAANAPVDLLAGQSIHLSPSGVLGEVTPVAPDGIAPWRKGFIRFASTPLAEALQEMERYGPTNLVIRSPDVAALPIGGSYRIGNPGAFARVLPQILPVRLVRRDDGKTEIVGIQETGDRKRETAR